ncbi:MAG: hydrogenase maturation protease [Burkholderiaceae bacterium]
MDVGNRILVLGLGNRLLSDDAAGPIVVDRLLDSAVTVADDAVIVRDGGTMGLSLLPEIQDAWGFVAVDAASFGAPPGTVRVFEGADMDALLVGSKKTAHEVALADLMAAAELSGSRPGRRALVAVQPVSVILGMAPTPAVRAAIDDMVIEVEALILRWRADAGRAGVAGAAAATVSTPTEGRPCAKVIPIALAPCRAGLERSVMNEISSLLERLVREPDLEEIIDLGSLPIGEAGREALIARLGSGEVDAVLSLLGQTRVRETGYAGVWHITHLADDRRVLSEQICVTRVPGILLAHGEDIGIAAERLRSAITPGDTDR